jgi:hypothetical protein
MRTIDVPSIRKAALEKLRGGGYDIHEAVTEATEEAPIDWGDSAEAQQEFIITLLSAGLEQHESCRVCGGALIGAERALGTCGHDGGRSKIPSKLDPGGSLPPADNLPRGQGGST